MPTDPAAVVDRYLAVVADLDAEPESLAALLDPAARFVEYPNLVAPSGRKRDVAAAGAAREHSRRLLAGHRFDVREHIVAGERVVTRATWTGTLALGGAAAGRHRAARRVLHGVHGARRAHPPPGELRLLPPGGLTFVRGRPTARRAPSPRRRRPRRR